MRVRSKARAGALTGEDGGVQVEARRLLGRAPELTALAEVVTDADAGRGRVALLAGSAGIGRPD